MRRTRARVLALSARAAAMLLLLLLALESGVSAPAKSPSKAKPAPAVSPQPAEQEEPKRLSLGEEVVARARASFSAGALDRAQRVYVAHRTRQVIEAARLPAERRLKWMAFGLLALAALWACCAWVGYWLRGGSAANQPVWDEHEAEEIFASRSASLPEAPAGLFSADLNFDDTPAIPLPAVGVAAPPSAWKSFGAAVAGRDSGAGGWRRGFENSPPEGDAPFYWRSEPLPERSPTPQPPPAPPHQGTLVASTPRPRLPHVGRMVASVHRTGWETLPSPAPHESFRSFERRFAQALMPPPDGVALSGDAVSASPFAAKINSAEPQEPGIVASNLKLRLSEGSPTPIDSGQEFMTTQPCPAVSDSSTDEPTSPIR